MAASGLKGPGYLDLNGNLSQNFRDWHRSYQIYAIQRPGEGFESYYTELRNTVKDCEFGSLEENLVRDRLVCGIIDEIVREKLLQVEDLTLEKCVNMCRLFESSAKQLRTLGSSQPEPDVHALRKMKLSSKTGQRHKWQTSLS